MTIKSQMLLLMTRKLLLQSMEWESHKQAKNRILRLFQEANWEAEEEGDLSVTNFDGEIREYKGDVVAVQRNQHGKVIRRVVVEIDTPKPGGGHFTARAIAQDNARTRAIAEAYFKEDNNRYITTVKRINTMDVIGKKKNHKEYFIDDDTLRLEFNIVKLQDWAAENA